MPAFNAGVVARNIAARDHGVRFQTILMCGTNMASSELKQFLLTNSKSLNTLVSALKILNLHKIVEKIFTRPKKSKLQEEIFKHLLSIYQKFKDQMIFLLKYKQH